MKTNLEQWFLASASEIESGLLLHANNLPAYQKYRVLPLSDLELCAAIDKRLVPLPPNFMVKQVEVRIGGRRWYTSHYIGTRGQEILDFVSGQFFTEERRQISGIAYMIEKAPQLLHVLSQEVVVLHAMMSEALEEFGIEYI